MKVAVCVSGLMEGNVEKNLARMKSVLPYDFHFSSWNTVKSPVVLDNLKVYNEPEPLDLVDINHPNKKIREKLRHSCKQILAHAYVLKDLDKSYDMIVRARYDVILNPEINWNDIILNSYSNRIPIGFANTENFAKYKSSKKIIYGEDKIDKGIPLGRGLNDHLIFHKRDLFNAEKVFELYAQKKLRTAEGGWWQVLVEENFAPKNHLDDPCINVCGAVLIEKYLTQDVIDTL